MNAYRFPVPWMSLLILLVCFCCGIPAPAGSANQMLTGADLVYQGAFAYPAGDDWTYSGQALAYYPNGDPSGEADGYTGSLYAAGSRNDESGDLVGEISIPAPVVSGSFAALPQAGVLQPLTDITGGWKDNCTCESGCIYRNVDGLAYLPDIDKIAWNLNDWYNTAGYDQDSLGWSDLDMTGAQGVWHIGQRGDEVFHNAKACNYLFLAPESFADTYLGGKRLIAGNTREAGAFGGSQGPTLYATAPWDDGNPPAAGQDLSALALLYYREKVSCVWDDWPDINETPTAGQCDFPDYRGADHWTGGAWIDVNGKAAILIAGKKGTGPNCYGTQSECSGDPCIASKGYHAYPYDQQILFYNPDDIIAVVSGAVDPWTVLPEETFSISDRMIDSCSEPGAATYDSENNFLFITEQEAGPDGETVVHVWRVAAGEGGDDNDGGDSSATAPDAADLISPADTVSDATPTYTWEAVPNATWYHLWVNDAGGNKIKIWYTAGECNCESGQGNCTLTPDTDLINGAGTWWVRTWNRFGYGDWSDGLDFTVSGGSTGPPSTASLLSPDGTVSAPVTFSWAAVPEVDWYYLWVNDSGGNRVKSWATAAECGCDGGQSTCAFTPAGVSWSSGAGTWWVRTWNRSGYGDWSDGLDFTVSGGSTGPPSTASLLSPDGTVSAPVTFSWAAVPEVDWYYLWVNDSGGNRVKSWATAAECGCDGGQSTCAFTPAGVSWSSGAGTWWVRTWNRSGYGNWSSGLGFTVQSGTSGDTAVIVDHTCTDLSQVPQSWINQAKSNLRLGYGHTSHGSQPVTGMTVLMNGNSLYAFNTDAAVETGILSLADSTPGGDLGHNGDTDWADSTRTYLEGSGSDRNVVVWSWCGGVSDNTEAGIDAYLSAMNALENDYPAVTFVYMTGHLDGTGTTGNLHLRNQQIRSYCRENGKILFDFADIESYDPDGAFYLDRGADDQCNYNSGNWAQQWCAANPGSDLCADCGDEGCCAHSRPLNCNLKARAFWWMLARIAGWDGPS